MQNIETRYGIIRKASRIEYYPQGGIRSCMAGEFSPLTTPWGELVPQYSSDEPRRKKLPVMQFHPDGTLQSIPLEGQVSLVTHAGTIPTEMFTTYPDGSLRRVFPLNGTLNAYWTQEDEGTLVTPLHLHTPLGPLCVRLSSIHFSPTGAVRSLTLWPGETLSVATPAGAITVRNGIAFYEDGSLESVEPDCPVEVTTRIGVIRAFNPDAVGISGDVNSLRFDREGNIIHVTTAMDCVQVIEPDGRRIEHAPAMRDSYCDEAARESVPMSVSFDNDVLRIQSVQPYEYSVQEHIFSVKRSLGGFTLPKYVCSI